MQNVDDNRSALPALASIRALAAGLPRPLLILAVLVLLTGAGVAQDAMQLPQSPAPRFFIVTALGVDDIELTEIDTAEEDMIVSTVYRPRLADLEIFDAGGDVLDVDALRERIGVGSVVLVAADENPVDPVYLSIVRDDTLVLVGVVVRVETE